MMNLIFPSGKQVFDGAIIKLGASETTYVLHYGRYTYRSLPKDGWYIQALGSNRKIPFEDYMVKTMDVLNDGSDIVVSESQAHHQCNHDCCNHTHCSDCNEVPFTAECRYLLDRSWITVDTLTERDSLPQGIVSTGRIVQVNKDEGGKPHYYRNNGVTWEEVDFVHVDQAATIEALQEVIDNLIEDINTLNEKVQKLEEGNSAESGDTAGTEEA